METLRKFNLNNCDLSTMLENLDFLLRISNVKIDKNNTRPINIVFVVVWGLGIFCYYYAYAVSLVWFVVVKYPVTGDFNTPCILFSILACSHLSFVTMFYIMTYKERLHNLIQSCLDLNGMVKPGTMFSKNLHKQLKLIKKRASIVWVAMFMNAVFYALLPLVIPGRHLPEDKQVIYGLDPIFESPNYEIAFVILSFGIYICGLFFANVTALTLVILGYVEAQLLALTTELQNLWEQAEIFYERHATSYEQDSATKYKIKNTFVNECLKDIALFHILNINIIRQFEDVFRGTKAVALLSTILAIISELLGGIETTYLQITYTLVVVFTETYAGQKLIDASNIYEGGVYSCNWENFDVHNMKIISTILPSAQRTLNITAGGVTVLDYCCFLAVIKFSYSVYNTLRLQV